MYNKNEIYRSSKLLEVIVKNQFYNCAANGDVVLMAALTRLVCFCLQFDKASYHHIKALEIQDKAEHERINLKDADRHLLLFNLQDAILGYNSCYDTILQAIKFAFRLVEHIETKEDFEIALEKCKWSNNENAIGIKELLNNSYYDTDETFNSFINESTSFFGEKRMNNAVYANSIKHNGGIIIPSLKTYIPSASKVNDEVNITIYPDGRCKFDMPHIQDSSLFMMEYLYPLEVKPREALQRLRTQNQWIYKYVKYLLEILQYNQLKVLVPLSGKYIFPFESIRKHDGQ